MKQQEQCLECVKAAAPWFKLVERRTCPLFHGLLRRGDTKDFLSAALTRPVETSNIVAIGDSIYFSRQSHKGITDVLESLVEEEGVSALEKLSKRCQQIASKLLEYVAAYEPCTEKAELESVYRETEKHFAQLSSYIVVTSATEKLLERNIKTLIQEKTGREDETYFQALTYPIERNASAREARDLLLLAGSVFETDDLKRKDVEEKIQSHAEKYGWIATRCFFERPWDSDEVKNRMLQHIESGNAKEKYAQIQAHEQQAAHTTKEFIEKHQLSAEEVKLILMVKEYVYLRTFRTEVLSHASMYMRSLITDIAHVSGIAFDDLIQLIPQEIEQVFEGSLDVAKVSLLAKERRAGYDFVFCNETSYIFSGTDRFLTEAHLGLTLENTDVEKEVAGSIAWKGSATGEVKIVKDTADIQKVSRGDILVAVMTFPHFAPAMERAAAFVTDEGGILCHAAIVAREMQKPCVIGTKKATQIFKDGDLVEVDAETGVVRIVKD